MKNSSFLRGSSHRQRGVVVLAMFIVLMTGSLYLLTAHLARATQHAPMQQEAQTRRVLTEAKNALITFAAMNRNRPGGLPCPDRNGDGESELSCDHPADRVGFLPWQTLATDDLRDVSGARLWYVVSAAYRNDANNIINPTTLGDLSIAADGVAVARHNDLAAAVIAPGAASVGQSRAGSVARADYIESVVGANLNEINRTRSNDRIDTVSAAELWASVERVVAERIEHDIAPLIESSYVQLWRRLPFSAPFNDPAQARTITAIDEPRSEGTLPGPEEAANVAWDRASIAVSDAGGGGALLAADCRRSIATEIRCDLHYRAPLRIRIDARALYAGRALVTPPSVVRGDFAPATLGMPSIEARPPTADGHAMITAWASLPLVGNMLRVSLHAPTPIRALVDRRIPVAEPHSWFARNEWFKFIVLATTPSLLPGPARPACTLTGNCLRIANSARHPAVPGLIIFTGRARVDARAAAIDRYLEGDNAQVDDQQFDARPNNSNDRVTPLCASGCGGVL